MFDFIENGSITSVNGFKAAGIHCGLKKKKTDLALIVSESPATAAGTFTLNKVVAAPLQVSKKIIANGNDVKAVLVNSGNANACTGPEGYQDALDTQSYCAGKLGIAQEEVLVSSTGVIGVKIDVDKLKSGIDSITEKLSVNGGSEAAEAIMTTDLKPKQFAIKVKLSQGEITIGSICKGSGMIMPNMATMLAFIGTDAKIEKELLQKLLSKAVNNSFNKVSVDGDTSTNDMVILMANGTSEIEITEMGNDTEIFYNALLELTKNMAKAIAADGEGATKLITINVTKAKTEEDANIIAKALANSPLVKTAIHGSDANWGRIISTAGASGVDIDPAKVQIAFGDHVVLEPGYKVTLDEEIAKEILVKDEVTINLVLNDGEAASTWWTCDFSTDYIKINASYRS